MVNGAVTLSKIVLGEVEGDIINHFGHLIDTQVPIVTVLGEKSNRSSRRILIIPTIPIILIHKYSLHQMLDEIGTFAWEHVDDGELDHRVAAGLLTHGSTGYVDQYLGGESRVVDAHVELEALVLGLARDALAHEVDTVTHVAHLID